MAEPTVAPGVYDAYRLRAGPDESQINEPKFMKQQINEQQINACDVEKAKLRTIIMSTMASADK
jgi:hypothetical protein